MIHRRSRSASITRWHVKVSNHDRAYVDFCGSWNLILLVSKLRSADHWSYCQIHRRSSETLINYLIKEIATRIRKSNDWHIVDICTKEMIVKYIHLRIKTDCPQPLLHVLFHSVVSCLPVVPTKFRHVEVLVVFCCRLLYICHGLTPWHAT